MADAGVLERPEAPAPDAMLTPAQACAWLQISMRQLQRKNLPAIRLGKRTIRYHVATVLEYLKRKALV